MDDVLVVGGGMAGLSCAWRLQRAGLQVRVVESKGRPGGNVWTEERDGFRWECGPHSFMASAWDIFDLARETGLQDELVPTLPAANDRFIVRHGKLCAIPRGPWEAMTTPLLSLRGKIALATEPLRTRRGPPTDTAQAFFTRRFGPEAARVLAGAFISGVYAGDPALLSAPAAFPLFWRFEQESGGMVRGFMRYGKEKQAQREARGEVGPARKGLWSFRGGLGRLSAGVAAKLGDRVTLSSPARSLRAEEGGYNVATAEGSFSSRKLVLACPPAEAARLLGPLDARLGEVLSSITLAPVAVVHMGFPRRVPEMPDGFGLLAPRGEGVRALGVLFPSRLFGDRTPPGGDLFSGFVGGMTDPGAMDLPDDDLLRLVTGDLAKLVGVSLRPDLTHVVRAPAAIPQLTLGHLERMAEVRERLQHLPGLLLAGNYLKGVGIKDAVASGFEAAAALGGRPA